MTMFRDSELAVILSGAGFLARQGIEWREDSWDDAQADPQVHADLSLLYGLAVAA